MPAKGRIVSLHAHTRNLRNRYETERIGRAMLQAQLMSSSKFIARLIGPLFVVSGIAMLWNHGSYPDMVEEFLRSPALIYIAGFLALLGGLAIVNVHNSWLWGWPLIVTVIGWLAVIGGTFRMVAPRYVQTLGSAMFAYSAVVIAIAILSVALGGFLSFKGYTE
jgi:hypothetical protein